MHRISRLVPVALALALVVPAAADAKKPSKPAPTYRVGMTTTSISLDPNGTFGGDPVYLGGYGLGNGHVDPRDVELAVRVDAFDFAMEATSRPEGLVLERTG